MIKFLPYWIIVLTALTIFNTSFALAQDEAATPVQTNDCDKFTPNTGGCGSRVCPNSTSTRCATSLSGDPDKPCGCHPKCQATAKSTPNIPCLINGQIRYVTVRHSECKEGNSSCATRSGELGTCTNIEVYGPCWDRQGNVGSTNTGEENAKKLSVCWCLGSGEVPPEEITQEEANDEIPRP